MSFHVIYVEDTEVDYKSLSDAIKEANETLDEWSKVSLTCVNHPNDLPNALNNNIDVVLADVYFFPQGTSSSAGSQQTDHLSEIISHVRDWDKKSQRGFPTPVIAYTSQGRSTLEKCLRQRNDLYDIWDKMSASPPYVSWRLQNLAKELSHYRPDATMQKLISSMPGENIFDTGWHNLVLQLVMAYSKGRTEYDQVTQCKNSISQLVDHAIPNQWHSFNSMWDAVSESEYLLRSTSPTLRGVARHSINVYWLGYWLINNTVLKDKIIKCWQEMLDKHGCPGEVRSASAIDLLNKVWFFAGIFHDAGKFPENAKGILSKYNSFIDAFSAYGLTDVAWTCGDTKILNKHVGSVLFDISEKEDDPLKLAIKTHIDKSLESGRPDHGAIVAARLTEIAESINDKATQFCMKVAAKAILLHSCLPVVVSEKNEFAISWKNDPIAALLLFCDQIQTWDRHGIDENHRRDYPERAELAFLEIENGVNGGTKPILRGCVNYIIPYHVEAYPGLCKRIAEDLENILKKQPKKALLHAIKQKDWPFEVSLRCSLGGELLATRLDFA